jgi:UDP-3-O-[3-hydroxymyristoyl] glucosamine N-acyltransferase
MAAVIHPQPDFEPGVHPSAVVAASATIARSAQIGANAVVADDVRIGDGSCIGAGAVVGPGCYIGAACRLHANVTFVRNVRIGDRCIFHSGAVIGADGFGNAMTPEGWVKVPQVGGVVVGDDVEVGACTTIDCGAIDDTVIGNGVRLDNQIQIGHNVHVGEHTAMAAGVAVAGSARIGKRCMLAGMVGVAGHISICDDVVVNGKGMVTKNITEPGTYASMFAVEPVGVWNRQVARIRRLGRLGERIRKLEKEDR